MINLYNPLRISCRRGCRGLNTRAWPLYQEFTAPSEEPDPHQKDEDLIEKKRNKSRLKPHHYRHFHKQPNPKLSEDEEYVLPVSYQRRLYGLHGAASGISPAILWPSKEEMALEKERESVTFPHSVHEMISAAKQQKEEEAQQIAQLQEDMVKKAAKLEVWKKEVQDRIAKKEREILEAQEKKRRQIEEVRQIFGFHIDPRDDRFKEALEKKEKEEKKAAKAAKKLARQQKMMEKFKQDAVRRKEGTAPPSTEGGDAKQTSASHQSGDLIV